MTSSTSSRRVRAGAAAVSLAFAVAGPAGSAPGIAATARQVIGSALADPVARLLSPQVSTPRVWTFRPGAPTEPMRDVSIAAALKARAEPHAATRSARVAEAGAARRPRRAVHRTESATWSRRSRTRPVVRVRATRSLSRRAARAARPLARGMNAVVSYAYAQLGSSYVRGASGGGRFDCSGLTMRAFARVGLSLPHSARGQAGRAHTVSRRAARPGDLVVGSGHVGVYVGGGYMIDAGNPRVGVSKRRLYAGLRVERF